MVGGAAPQGLADWRPEVATPNARISESDLPCRQVAR